MQPFQGQKAQFVALAKAQFVALVACAAGCEEPVLQSQICVFCIPDELRCVESTADNQVNILEDWQGDSSSRQCISE